MFGVFREAKGIHPNFSAINHESGQEFLWVEPLVLSLTSASLSIFTNHSQNLSYPSRHTCGDCKARSACRYIQSDLALQFSHFIHTL